MKKYCTTNKNKAFVIFITVLLSFFILSICLVVQILINSRYKIIENQYSVNISLNKIEYLDNIVREEIKIIEELINNNKIEDASAYFDKNLNNEKIFLLENFNTEFSQGGYKVYYDVNKLKNRTYYQYLTERINNRYPQNISIYYDKNIFLDNKKILIRAELIYITDISRKPENLKNAVLKGIEIVEND